MSRQTNEAREIKEAQRRPVFSRRRQTSAVCALERDEGRLLHCLFLKRAGNGEGGLASAPPGRLDQ